MPWLTHLFCNACESIAIRLTPEKQKKDREQMKLCCVHSQSLISCTNSMCRWRGSDLISLSARIAIVKVYLMVICFLWTSYLNQYWWISTRQSFVVNLKVSDMNTHMVCMLSHSMNVSCPRWNLIDSKKCIHQIVLLPAVDMASNLALVEFVITIFCFDAF